MKKIIYILIIVCLCFYSLLSQQCLEDRHTTNISDAWVSCQTSTNPNASNGNSHWILYNFDANRTLYTSTIWNINHPEYLDYGVKRIRIDYSLDKINWTNWGEMEISQAPARSDYLGEPGPDFNGLEAKHVLITVLESYGDVLCTGFSEIKILTEEPGCIDELVFNLDDNIYGLESHQAIKITARNKIHNSADVSFKAEESIQLLEEFSLELGANLHALIKDCDINDNMMINGDFEVGNLNPWAIELHQTANATISIDNSNPFNGNACARVDVTSTTSTSWHIQFQQFGMSVYDGQSYILEFAARSSVNKTIVIEAGRHNSPWNSYHYQDINLTPSWQIFSMSFIPDETNIDFLRIASHLSNNDPATYWFDSFVLREQ